MPERYWLTFSTRHRHGPPTQELVYYQREGPERWRLYYGKAGRRRHGATDSTRMVEHQVDLARSEGRFIRHEPDQAEQGRMFNPLVRGYSRGAISENISREMHAGRAQDQAVAIALDVGRRAYRARHPRGRVPAHLRRNPAMPRLRHHGRRAEAEALLIEHTTRNNVTRNPAELEAREFRRRARMPAAEREALERAELEAFRGSGAFRSMMQRRDAMAATGPYGRRRRRRRNPMGHGEWIDVLVPVVALFVLVRGGILRLGGNTPSAAAPRP